MHGGTMHGGTMHGGTMHGGTMHGGTMHGGTMHGGTMHGGTMHGGTMHVSWAESSVITVSFGLHRSDPNLYNWPVHDPDSVPDWSLKTLRPGTLEVWMECRKKAF